MLRLVMYRMMPRTGTLCSPGKRNRWDICCLNAHEQKLSSAIVRSFMVVSFIEHGADIPVTHGLICERKRAVLPHFPGSAKKRAKRGAGECTANADAFYPNLGELGEIELYALQPHDHIHWPIDGTDHCGNIIGGKYRTRGEALNLLYTVITATASRGLVNKQDLENRPRYHSK